MDAATRRSYFDQSHMAETAAKQDFFSGKALPEVSGQKMLSGQKYGNMDFDHMFETSNYSSTKQNS